jgi:putative oxidoreductase
MADILFLIGRIIVGLFFLMNAGNHFMQLGMMVPYAKSKGVPQTRLAVLGTGLLLLVAAVTLVTGFYPDVGVAALVVFFVPVSVMMHNFWAIDDEQQKMVEMVNFTKNMALLGFALMTLAIPEPWELSLG